jgi:hypothetical protein
MEGMFVWNERKEGKKGKKDVWAQTGRNQMGFNFFRNDSAVS